MPVTLEFGHVFIDPINPLKTIREIQAAIDSVIDEGELRARTAETPTAAKLRVSVELLDE